MEKHTLLLFILLSIIAVGILLLLNCNILQQQLTLMKDMNSQFQVSINEEEDYVCMKVEKGINVQLQDYTPPTEV